MAEVDKREKSGNGDTSNVSRPREAVLNSDKGRGMNFGSNFPQAQGAEEAGS